MFLCFGVSGLIAPCFFWRFRFRCGIFPRILVDGPGKDIQPICPSWVYHFGFGRGGTGLHVAGTLSSLFRTGCLGGGGGGGGSGVATTHIMLFYQHFLSASNLHPHMCSNAGDWHQTTCSQSAHVTLGRSVKARPKRHKCGKFQKSHHSWVRIREDTHIHCSLLLTWP